MLINELSIRFVKTFFMNLCMAFSYAKIKNSKTITKKENILLFVINVLISAIYAIIFEVLRDDISVGLLNLICYSINLLIMTKIINRNYKSFIILLFISLCFGFISFSLATLVNFIVLKIVLYEDIVGSWIEYLIVGIIQFALVYGFFKIKRFKDGFSFLKDENNKTQNILGLIVSIVILLIFIYYCLVNDVNALAIIFCTLFLGCIVMFNWIRKSITKNYKSKMKDRTVELQAEQIKEKDETINNLKEELDVALSINHKYNSRLSSMEKLVSTLGTKLEFNEEFAKEYADIKESLDELAKEYRNELFTSTELSNLSKTNILSIDNLLEYMKSEANKENIKFELEIYGNINRMIENVIPKSKLETMIADHIKDAIIAIKSSDNTNKSILVALGNKDDYYELSVSDTGIEFEIDTLLKLGLEKVTTHKEEGGSGIGFMTTFEAMKETKASLIIEEHPISDSSYTKSVKIRFDGNNEYKIISYRAEKIKEKTKDDRIKLFTTP